MTSYAILKEEIGKRPELPQKQEEKKTGYNEHRLHNAPGTGERQRTVPALHWAVVLGSPPLAG